MGSHTTDLEQNNCQILAEQVHTGEHQELVGCGLGFRKKARLGLCLLCRGRGNCVIALARCGALSRGFDGAHCEKNQLCAHFSVNVIIEPNRREARFVFVCLFACLVLFGSPSDFMECQIIQILSGLIMRCGEHNNLGAAETCQRDEYVVQA
jgi:hypothetical protein